MKLGQGQILERELLKLAYRPSTIVGLGSCTIVLVLYLVVLKFNRTLVSKTPQLQWINYHIQNMCGIIAWSQPLLGVYAWNNPPIGRGSLFCVLSPQGSFS
jgi:hypothetical protein